MKERIFYLDIIRVVAMTLVTLLHSVADTFLRSGAGSPLFNISNVLYCLASIGVLLFVYISGAIFLDEKYELTCRKLAKHILRLVIFFIFWSVIYTSIFDIFFPLREGLTLNVTNIFKTFFKGFYHLWYIYLIIFLYLITPLLRRFIKKEHIKKIGVVVTLLLLVVSSISLTFRLLIAYRIYDLSIFVIYDKYHLDFIVLFPLIYILGYLLHNIEFNRWKYVIYILGVLGFISSIIGNTYLKSFGIRSIDYGYTHADSPMMILSSLSLFILIKSIIKKEYKIITFLSSLSLGIYGSHPMFCVFSYMILDNINNISGYLYIPITFIFAFICSVLLSYIFSKIPYLKRIV